MLFAGGDSIPALGVSYLNSKNKQDKLIVARRAYESRRRYISHYCCDC